MFLGERPELLLNTQGRCHTAHASRHIVTNDEPHGVAACLYLKLAAVSKSVGTNLLSNIRGQHGTLISWLNVRRLSRLNRSRRGKRTSGLLPLLEGRPQFGERATLEVMTKVNRKSPLHRVGIVTRSAHQLDPLEALFESLLSVVDDDHAVP